MNKINKLMNKTKGFTLVESLIYVFLASLLLVVLFTLLLNFMRVFITFRAERMVTHSATVAIDRLFKEIRQADEIDASNSIFATNPGYLALDQNQLNPTSFYLTDGVLMMQDNSGSEVSLTDQAVTATNLIFHQINTTRSQAVRFELTLRDNQSSPRYYNFYGTAVLRGSY